MRLFIVPIAILIGYLLRYFIVNPFFLARALVIGMMQYIGFVFDTLSKWTRNYLKHKLFQ